MSVHDKIIKIITVAIKIRRPDSFVSAPRNPVCHSWPEFAAGGVNIAIAEVATVFARLRKERGYLAMKECCVVAVYREGGSDPVEVP